MIQNCEIGWDGDGTTVQEFYSACTTWRDHLPKIKEAAEATETNSPVDESAADNILTAAKDAELAIQEVSAEAVDNFSTAAEKAEKNIQEAIKAAKIQIQQDATNAATKNLQAVQAAAIKFQDPSVLISCKAEQKIENASKNVVVQKIQEVARKTEKNIQEAANMAADKKLEAEAVQKIREASKMASKLILGAAEKNAEYIQEAARLTADYPIYADLNPYIQNVIMVDGLDEDKGCSLSPKPLETLRLMILTHLMTLFPCVAIGTLRHGKDGWKDSASLVKADIPVLYIDVRQHSPSKRLPAEHANPVRQKTETVKKIGELKSLLSTYSNREAAYQLSTAFPEEEDKDNNLEWESFPITERKEKAAQLIKTAMTHKENESKCIKESGRVDVLDACRMAYWHSICHRAETLINGNQKSKTFSIYEAISILENEKMNEEVRKHHQGQQIQVLTSNYMGSKVLPFILK
jgi:hypothetical protein